LLEAVIGHPSLGRAPGTPRGHGPCRTTCLACAERRRSMKTNMSETGLEKLILRATTERSDTLSFGHKATELSTHHPRRTTRNRTPRPAAAHRAPRARSVPARPHVTTSPSRVAEIDAPHLTRSLVSAPNEGPGGPTSARRSHHHRGAGAPRRAPRPGRSSRPAPARSTSHVSRSPGPRAGVEREVLRVFSPPHAR
jgi:hypothetical protein